MPAASRPGRARRLILVLAVAAVAFPLGAVASHQFPDVPDSNPFHADIDALVDSGVTSGCGGGNYCPSTNVTREQMAAFLNRLGALAPGKTPVVNADKVDGYQANGLIRAAHGGNSSTIALPWSNSSYLDYFTVTLTAPTNGYVQVNASTTARATSCTEACAVVTFVYHEEGGVLASPSVAFMSPNEIGAMSVSGMFSVNAGLNTFTVQMARSNSSSAVDSWFGEANAVFTPFDSNGVASGGFTITSGGAVDPLTKAPLAP